MKKIKIMIVDDHELFNYGMKEILKRVNEFDVIAQARNGKEAIELANELFPDIIIMDIDMPAIDGIQATKIIKSSLPCKVIILTMHEEKKYLNELKNIGADAYVNKNFHPEKLVEVIKNINSGYMYFHNSVSKVKEDTQKYKVKEHNAQEPFTDKELEILRLLTKGLSNKNIAKALKISENTVKNHISNMLKKIDVEDRIQLVIYAFKNDLGEF